MSYIPLHNISSYSLLSSSIRINSLVEMAKEKNFEAIALTDMNVLYGAIDFYKKCKTANIKPIIGLTLSIYDEGTDESYPVILLAQNNTGYTNLMKLSSVVQTKNSKGVPKKWMRHYSVGLIAIVISSNNEFLTNLEDEEKLQALFTEYVKMFNKGCLFLGVDRSTTEAKQAEARIREKINLPLVAINTAKYLQRNEAFLFECLQAIKNGATIKRLPEEAPYYLKSKEEMVELFHDIPEAMENTFRISRECNVTIPLQQRLLPKYLVPDNKNANEYLEERCWEGLRNRIPNLTKAYSERLQYELDVIKRMDFSHYFLIVWDFMDFARQKGIMTGPGRGSAAGSLVAYCLYITGVDPIKHNLLFERFLNPERISMPDIDIDFPDNRRDEVIEYVVEKYGVLHVAQIITFGTLAAKAAWRDVAKALNLSPKEVDVISKLIPSRVGVTLESALKESEPFRRAIYETKERQRAFEVAKKLEGLPRHTSTHAAGVVISEKPLTEIIPIQSGSHNVYLTQFPMETLEEIGLLKMDFLGLRNLTLIQNIRTSLKYIEKVEFPIDFQPPEDEKTFKLLGEGDTSGIFQLESAGMRKVLQNLKPNSLEDIVAVNALYRPGPMEQIPIFIERKHGQKQVEYPHRDLISILEPTYGVIVYQEQIMQIASTMAGFSLGEADLLRRAVGKKKQDVLAKERAHFVKGCKENGYDEKTAHDIYDLIVKFANYGFNRSHAVAYSMIAYELAFLKANYRKVFMTVLLSSVLGNEQKISQYVAECKKSGIDVLPPSINNSGIAFQVEQEGIRFGLVFIKGIGAQIIKQIIEERKKKPFTDLFDFIVRLSPKVTRRTAEILIYSGCLDEFGQNRATLLATLDAALQHAELVKPNEDEDQIGFLLEEEFNIEPKYVVVEPLPVDEQLHLEKEVLGFYLSHHPTEIYGKLLQLEGVNSIGNIELLSTPFVKVGAYITKVRSIRTRKGEVMAFISASDATGDIDAVVFPTDYQRLSDQLEVGKVLVLEGKKEERNGKTQLIVRAVNSMEQLKNKYEEIVGSVYLKIDETVQPSANLKQLQQMLQTFKGPMPVVAHYVQSKKTVQLSREYFVTPSKDCLEALKLLLGDSNVVFKKEALFH